MGITKSEIFTGKQNKLANMLKALAHPARIAIVEYLFNSKSCICGDLVEELGLAQATVSQHLKELKTAYNNVQREDLGSFFWTPFPCSHNISMRVWNTS